MDEQRFAEASRAAWVGILGNVGLASVKAVTGWFSGSSALMADAVHSATDIAGSLAVLIGIKAAQMPPDKDHPYGHGKAESIAAIMVSVILAWVGLQLTYTSIQTIWMGVSHAPQWYASVIILFSILIKEAMFQYKYRLGVKMRNKALIANAWEHRSDVYSGVAALIGVGGALLGTRFDTPWLYYLDPIAGLVVALMVLHMGYVLIKDAIHSTLDHVLHDEDAQELVKAVQDVQGVISVDELRAREHGHYVIVDVKISVNPRLTVFEGHLISKRVKKFLLRTFEHVSDVFVHVNPYDPGYPCKGNHHSLEDETLKLLQ